MNSKRKYCVTKNIILSLCISLLLYFPTLNVCLYAQDNFSGIKKLIGNDDAIIVADSTGKIILEKNSGKRLVPASILKILTSLAAFHYLGHNYRFETDFYIDNNSNLKVKGYGDPLLISENISDIAEKLSSKIEYINDIVLDDSYFSSAIPPGAVALSPQPYDSPNGALCANFNTVNFNVINGKFVSAESQTPLLPFAVNLIKKSDIRKGRILLSSEYNENTLYTGHLISWFLERKGIKTKGQIRKGLVCDKTDKLILKYYSSFSIKDGVSKLLLYSNNFIANQLVLAIGAKMHGQPGTLENGVFAIKDYATKTLNIDDLSIIEGSGISRNNSISAKSFLKILAEFKPYMHLMKHKGNEYFKTGTLKDVSTRSGYIKGPKGRLFTFVILTNSKGKSAEKISKRLRSLLDG
ncbi:MAG: D-alanyl-D-alanine carboxypeptidase [Proteobacteria bacterium]|nr:D-alanyl-D-alanine carboxypeptidase [Pseudomonadota bacterium]